MAVNKSKEEMRRDHRNTRERQQKLRRRAIYATLVLFVVIIGFILAFTVFFNIRRFEVRGYSVYTDAQIIEASGVSKGDNLVALNREKVEKNITKKLPYIASVEIKNGFPDKIIFVIHEDAIRSAVETSSGVILLDKDGKVLSKVATLDEVYADCTLPGGVAYNSEEKTTKKTEKSTSTTTTTTTTTTATGASTTKKSKDKSTTTEKKKAKYVLAGRYITTIKGVDVEKAEVGSPIEFKKDKSFDTYSEIMNLLDSNKIDGIVSIDISNVSNLKMMYIGDIEVRLGTSTDLDGKINLLGKIIESGSINDSYQGGKIDLTIYSSQSKGYLSPKRETTTKTTTTESTTVDENEENQTTTTTTKKHTTTTKSSTNKN